MRTRSNVAMMIINRAIFLNPNSLRSFFFMPSILAYLCVGIQLRKLFSLLSFWTCSFRSQRRGSMSYFFIWDSKQTCSYYRSVWPVKSFALHCHWLLILRLWDDIACLASGRVQDPSLSFWVKRRIHHAVPFRSLGEGGSSPTPIGDPFPIVILNACEGSIHKLGFFATAQNDNILKIDHWKFNENWKMEIENLAFSSLNKTIPIQDFPLLWYFLSEFCTLPPRLPSSMSLHSSDSPLLHHSSF